jgi:alpha-ketoglutarate-dependent taurine dioxygenase
MKLTNINDTWGTIVEFSDPYEFFSQPKGYWRNIAYERKLVIFKKMAFKDVDYGRFSYHIGMPWTKEEYKYSHENAIEVTDNEKKYVITKFNSLGIPTRGPRQISLNEMPWHADIPNRSFKPFPFRSLWMGSRSRIETSGQTQWLNIEDSIDSLSDKLKNLIPRIKIKQQSWYDGGRSDVDIHDFIKIHPITGRKSLRLNYYVGYPLVKNSQNAWIKNVYIDGIEQPDNSLIQEYIDDILKIPNMYYKHSWDIWDIALYDNYPFIHGRSSIQFDLNSNTNTSDRILYRINIDHVADKDWENHTLN